MLFVGDHEIPNPDEQMTNKLQKTMSKTSNRTHRRIIVLLNHQNRAVLLREGKSGKDIKTDHCLDLCVFAIGICLLFAF
jgi:hypothetical protein